MPNNLQTGDANELIRNAGNQKGLPQQKLSEQKLPQRRSIRLKGYDYAQEGLYFITICCQDRAYLFGKILNGEMILNDAGKMVVYEWLKLTERFENIQLHEYVVMPNHFHAIFQIVGAPLVVDPDQKKSGGQPQGIAPTEIDFRDGQPQGIAPTGIAPTVGDIIGAFKSIVTVEYIRGIKSLNWKPFNKRLWQRNYWEHIIRTERAYQTISNYIINNPRKWESDKLKTK